ncbi:unnamed protein product [Miscanthus lutarioriparius]|uniref:DNA-directed DNA polymerase family A palm domain-containing protein n=1 Tax=Miscanthus lutarioriparius TaxID=422564 RepID=A0A811SAY9_9POAL|nr:unnamed protein product [Miscanthus lutarioriparius]
METGRCIVSAVTMPVRAWREISTSSSELGSSSTAPPTRAPGQHVKELPLVSATSYGRRGSCCAPGAKTVLRPLIGCHCQVALVALHCCHFILDEGEISEELVHRGLEVHGGDGVGHEQEIPIAYVCETFKVARGMIQALQENAGRFASMVSAFCQRLGWNDLEGLVSKFQNRVSFGVRAEIAELTSIPFVKGSRARALYKYGLCTPVAIAEASIPEIAKALFESSGWSGQDSGLRRMQFGIAKKIKNGARKIVLEEAEAARVAAFSAFKSLGVEVPQFTAPPLAAIEDYPTRDTIDQAKSNKLAFGTHARDDKNKNNCSDYATPRASTYSLRKDANPAHSIQMKENAELSKNVKITRKGAAASLSTEIADGLSSSVYNGLDTCLLAWVLWPDEESRTVPNLEKFVKRRLHSEAAAAANRDGRWRNQMHKAAHNGCCRRAAQTRALYTVLKKLLTQNLSDLVETIEAPLINVLADMELWGIGADMDACLRARHIITKKLKELEKEAYRLAGKNFSLNATADIADILYTHLKLPVPKGCEKGKLHPSTDKQSLDHLRDQHPIIPTSTATGRLSMEEPNLQENWLFVTADYSQIELRLMAHFSKDPTLVELLSKPDGDVFTMIASRWAEKEEALISSKERENTKRFIYGIPYGMGANSLAEQLECSTEEAAQKIQSFRRLFPGVSSWLHEVVLSYRQKVLVYLVAISV